MTNLRTEPVLETNLDELVRRALAEDLGDDGLDFSRDLTTRSIVAEEKQATAHIVARQSGVIAGLEVTRNTFHLVDDAVQFPSCVADGDVVEPDQVVVALRGRIRALLTAERTALNFLQRLSGIATLTRAFVNAVDGTGVAITDTRKTTPGLRQLEKQAVRMGGGENHRMGLYDAVLIKENHAESAGGPDRAVERARAAAAETGEAVPVYAEARNLKEVRLLINAAPDRIMLDNMPVDDMKRAVEAIREGARGIEIEATGGVTLHAVREIAATGVNLVSVGALTHSAPAFDLSLLIVREG